VCFRRLFSCSFNPKPEAMADAACGRSMPLPAIAFGFGLNEYSQSHCERVLSALGDAS